MQLLGVLPPPGSTHHRVGKGVCKSAGGGEDGVEGEEGEENEGEEVSTA